MILRELPCIFVPQCRICRKKSCEVAMRSLTGKLPAVLMLAVLPTALLWAVDKQFHNAPDSAAAMKNPFEGQDAAAQVGKRLYARNCLSCHGKTGQGKGNIPSLVDGKLETVPSGEVFWFITKGSKDNGMPAWAFLPARQRWQIVTYVKSLGASETSSEKNAAPAPEATTSTLKAPPPKPPFTDFRYEKPGTTRKITVADLPAPNATPPADNG